jgi:hypothetical protein
LFKRGLDLVPEWRLDRETHGARNLWKCKSIVSP